MMDQSQHPAPTTSSLEMLFDKLRSSRASDRAYCTSMHVATFHSTCEQVQGREVIHACPRTAIAPW